MTTTKENAAANVQQLREQVEALKLQDIATRLETQIRHREHRANLIEGWGDYINPLDMFRGEEAFFGNGGGLGMMGPRHSRASDRADGDNAPFFTNESELAMIRGAGEWIAQADTTAIGALATLASYCVGTDGQYDAGAKEGDSELPGAEQAAAAVQPVLDEFLRRVKWNRGTNRLDRESFLRWRRAGESFIQVLENGATGYCSVRVWEPAWITEPASPRSVEAEHGLPELDWKYGVATTPGDAAEVWGYFGIRNGDVNRGEFIPAAEMVFLKCNTDGNVKRGMTDFYPSQQWLEKGAKVLDRVIDGAAIQASIALIRRYAPNFRKANILSAADSHVEFDQVQPSIGGGTRSVGVQRFASGTVVDAQGVDTEAGPMGQSNAPVYLEVVDAAVTKALRIYGMQKSMATGDANTDTYASALVRESPLTKFCEDVQGVISAAWSDMLWRVVDVACIAGRLPYEPQQLRQLIDVKVTLPDVEVRNRLETHQIRKEQNAAGILSRETWSEQEGLSFEQEQARGAQSEAERMLAAKTQAMADAAAGGGMGGMGGGYAKEGTRAAAIAEGVRSCRTLAEAVALLEGVK
jgi:hypothetical protein